MTATEALHHAEIETAAAIAYAQLHCECPDVSLDEADRAVFEAGFAAGLEWLIHRIKGEL